MAATTYRFVANDILRTLKQVFDDRDVQMTQVIYWIQVVLNRLRVVELREENIDNGQYDTIFPSVTVNIDKSDNLTGKLEDRKYIVLPDNVYNFEMDGAIKYVTYSFDQECCESGPTHTAVFFQPTTVMKSHRLYRNNYEKPSPDNPYFYRTKNIIYLLGIECIAVDSLEMCLTTTLDPKAVCNLDDPIEISENLIQQLKLEVFNLGRFIFNIPRERINEGSDLTTQQAAVTDGPGPNQAQTPNNQ